MEIRSLVVSQIPKNISFIELEKLLNEMFNVKEISILVNKRYSKTINSYNNNCIVCGKNVSSVRIVKNKEKNECVGYAIVDFVSKMHAESAILYYGNYPTLPKYHTTLVLDWSKSSCCPFTIDEYQLYIGCIHPDVDEEYLKNEFKIRDLAPTDIKIIKDKLIGRSRGFAFIRFENIRYAYIAVQTMQNIEVKGYIWVVRLTGQSINQNVVDYQNLTNTCVFIAGIGLLSTEKDIEEVFGPFGKIRSIKMFAIRRFCFVVYEEHESAVAAITHMTGFILKNNRISCSWGKNNPYKCEDYIEEEEDDNDYLQAEQQYVRKRQYSLLPQKRDGSILSSFKDIYYQEEDYFKPPSPNKMNYNQNIKLKQVKTKTTNNNNIDLQNSSVNSVSSNLSLEEKEEKKKAKTEIDQLYWLTFYAKDSTISLNQLAVNLSVSSKLSLV